MKGKNLVTYLTGAAMAVSPIGAGAELEMDKVMSRNEGKNISLLDVRDKVLREAWGHFLPFDRRNITYDGKIIEFDNNLINHIIANSYPNGGEQADNLRELLRGNKDFYIAGENGSFRLLVDNLTGTTDREPGTSFTDIEINDVATNYLRTIARKTSRKFTEAYHLYNDVRPFEVVLEGGRIEMIDDLSDKLGIAMGKNSGSDVMEELVETTGLEGSLDKGLKDVGRLEWESSATLKFKRDEGGIWYKGVVKDEDAKVTEIGGRSNEGEFWSLYDIGKPSEKIGVDTIDTYLGIILPVPQVAGANPLSEEGKSEIPKGGNPVSTRTSFTYSTVVAGAYPFEVGAGPRINFGRGYLDIVGGVGVEDESVHNVFEGDVRNGRQRKLETTGKDDINRYFVGANLGYRPSENWSVNLGAYLRKNDIEPSGLVTPQEYVNGELVRLKSPQQRSTGKGSKWDGSWSFGPGYKNFSVHLRGKKKVTGAELRLNFGGK